MFEERVENPNLSGREINLTAFALFTFMPFTFTKGKKEGGMGDRFSFSFFTTIQYKNVVENWILLKKWFTRLKVNELIIRKYEEGWLG